MYKHTVIVYLEHLKTAGVDKHATTVLLAPDQRSIVDWRRVSSFWLILIVLVAFLCGMIDLLHLALVICHARDFFTLVVLWLLVLFLFEVTVFVVRLIEAKDIGPLFDILLKLDEIVCDLIQSLYRTNAPINLNW